MKRAKIEPEKAVTKKVMKKNAPKSKKPAVEKMEDVKRLVELLKIHQVELEHQNQELRIAQEELEVSRNKYVNLFDFSPVPYFTLNPEGIIKEVNLSASKLFGIDRSKLIGKRFAAYIPMDDKENFNSFLKTVFTSPEKYSCELNVISKDNRLFNVLLEGLELEDKLESVRTCQVALIDLTDYKKIEDILRKYNEELKELSAIKDKFFSIIAHDLRSPFQSLLSSSEMLASDIESLSQEEIESFSKGLNDNLNNLYRLLENLLNWSLIQRNMIVCKPVNINLYALVNSILETSDQNAKKKKILISNNIDTAAEVYADVDMLRSVIQNLISNAIKFTKSEGRIIILSKENDGFVEVSIHDTGMGIESAELSKLFSLGKLFTTNGTAEEKGTGLGLPLCKEFAEKNGGKIWVESEIGKGSVFTFSLRKAI